MSLGLLAWIAFIPWFFAIDGRRPVVAFLISYLAGLLFFLVTVWWLIHVTFPGMLIVVAYLALYFAVFGFIVSATKALRPSFLNLFAIPSMWVAVEWLRGHLLTGFGWALLGYSQTKTPTIIQIADLTGAYGVSFLIVLVNAAIYFTLKDIRRRKYDSFYLAAALLILFLALGYGTIRMKNIFTGEAVKVAVVQGNIPQSKKWDAAFREEILTKYESLTGEAAALRPDLIVWPEASVPGFLEIEQPLYSRVSALAAKNRAPLLVGTPTETKAGALYNSAVLFDSDGKMLDRYDKLHLVPFGEYLPLKKAFSFVERFAPNPIGEFSPGSDYKVFKFFVEKEVAGKDTTWKFMKKVRFSCLICFEDIFPELAREFVRRGAHFLVNMTNDAWFGRSSAPYQHAESSIFRAVENRVNVVRAANTGYSCMIDQKGVIVASVSKEGRDIFVDGVAAQDIILTNTRTFYTTYGDIFAYLCMAMVALYAGTALIPRKQKQGR